jgi:hypothetical protein
VDVILALGGVLVGWGLKSFSDYIGMRREEIRTYNKAIFFILRAWKNLLDYDRGTDHFRKKKPSPQEFEKWRSILAAKFIENFTEQSETVSQAVRVLAEVDPIMATRLDNTIQRILSTFPPHIAELASTDPERYQQLIYNQDNIVDHTLNDIEKVASKIAARSSVQQQVFVWRYFRSVRKGTLEFNEGMNEQDEMLKKVTSP